MSNQSEFPSEDSDLEALRVRLVLKKGIIKMINMDCLTQKRKPHDQVSFIVEEYYERKAKNG